jgi:hypothetical protein
MSLSDFNFNPKLVQKNALECVSEMIFGDEYNFLLHLLLIFPAKSEIPRSNDGIHDHHHQDIS